ncbi:MAG: Asp-tRNA(Asn)/Glu-tRNA(Gln) amidotransferase subunit GatC [Planctomycetota bacterium]
MKIDDKLIEHLCSLARLSVSPQDKESLKQGMSEILAYVDSLKEIDVTNIEPLIHSLDEKHLNLPELTAGQAGIWRDDKAHQNSLTPDKALQNAPKRKGNFFEVPRIIE